MSMENAVVENKSSHQRSLEAFSCLYDEIMRHGVSRPAVRTHFFNKVGFPKVSISEDHKEKCLEHAKKMDLDALDDAYDKLVKYLELYIENNNKVLSVVRLAKVAAVELVETFENLLKVNGPEGIRRTYPFLPKEQDKVSEELEPIKCKRFGDSKVMMILGARRCYHKIFKLNKDDIKESRVSQFDDLSDITAKGLFSELAVDILVVDVETGLLEIRLSNASKMAKDNRNKFNNKLFHFARKHSGSNLSESFNFFDSILPLYFDNEDNGFITRFDFLTDEGVERSEKSNFDRKDIRGEVYHISGATSIKHTFQAFGIRKAWLAGNAGDVNYKIKIDISGGVRLLSSGAPFIHHVFLLDCYDSGDYYYLMNKLSAS